jgi:hypothetical protein
VESSSWRMADPADRRGRAESEATSSPIIVSPTGRDAAGLRSRCAAASTHKLHSPGAIHWIEAFTNMLRRSDEVIETLW